MNTLSPLHRKVDLPTYFRKLDATSKIITEVVNVAANPVSQSTAFCIPGLEAAGKIVHRLSKITFMWSEKERSGIPCLNHKDNIFFNSFQGQEA